MRSALLAATFLTAVALPLSATTTTTTTDTFTISGIDDNNAPYQVAFSLNPADFTSGDPANGYGYLASGSINHVSDLFNIYEATGADTSLYIFDYNNGVQGTYNQLLVLYPNNATQLFNNAGSTPTVNVGTFAGYDDTSCDASLHTPSLGFGGPLSTLALFQAPVIVSNCGSSISVTASGNTPPPPTPPTTVTPEPASLALFGTGALGLFGVARRRLAR